jgi:XTP/dITP diphosphohydrolase
MRYHLAVDIKTYYNQILIATTNLGKGAEIAKLLDGCAAEFIGLNDLKQVAEPVEDGLTFADNAQIKARYYAAKYNLPTVADDSGLMVDALDGAPGVLSSRLVPKGEGDAARNRKLLAMMEHIIAPEKRRAKFICAACFVDSASRIEFVEEGELAGTIAFEPSGDAGFGFDPLFIPEGYDRTVASLGLEMKNRISHRKRAFEKLARRIRSHCQKRGASTI